MWIEMTGLRRLAWSPWPIADMDMDVGRATVPWRGPVDASPGVYFVEWVIDPAPAGERDVRPAAEPEARILPRDGHLLLRGRWAPSEAPQRKTPETPPRAPQRKTPEAPPSAPQRTASEIASSALQPTASEIASGTLRRAASEIASGALDIDGSLVRLDLADPPPPGSWLELLVDPADVNVVPYDF